MAEVKNIIHDLATLTHVPKNALTTLFEKEASVISSVLFESKQAGEEIVLLNIGLGTLSVDLKTMDSKFIPSKSFKAKIKNALIGKTDPLDKEIEQSIVEKLLKVCDEVF